MRCDECLRTLKEYSAIIRKDGSYCITYVCINCNVPHIIDTRDLTIQKAIIE